MDDISNEKVDIEEKYSTLQVWCKSLTHAYT